MARSKHSIFANIGASNHSSYDREKDDYYATDVSAIDMLHKHNLLVDGKYWECACGDGRLSERLKEYGYDVISSDLFDRGYGVTGVDFLIQENGYDNIITNPPYTFINDFLVKGIELAEHRLYIFARLQTLETIGRYNKVFKDNPPRYVCPFVKRIPCYRGGENDKRFKQSAVAYAWFIWDKTEPDKECEIRWLI